MFPITAVSVIDIRGSAMPAIKAGIASLLILLKLISVFKKNTILNTKLQFEDGRKLYHSKKLSGVPKFDYTKDMYITPSFGKDKGFSGYISRLRYYNIPIKKNLIQYLYRDGPINNNPIPKLIGYFKKIAGSIKFNVKVDVDIDTE